MDASCPTARDPQHTAKWSCPGSTDTVRVVLWPWKGVVMATVFSQEFKDQVVELFRRGGRTFMDIGKEFDLSPTTVSNWVRSAENKEGRLSRADHDDRALDRAEIALLRRQLAQREEELEILGKALAFFARRRDQ